MTASIRRHPLVWYFSLAFLVSWIGVSPLVAAGLGLVDFEVPALLHGLGAFGPIAAAFIVTRVVSGATAVGRLWERMTRWKGPALWWGLAILSPFLIFGIACVAARLTAGMWPAWGRLAESATDAAWLANLAVASVLYGFGEETGWRGFALPRLQAEHGALVATVILTVFWALWHLPFFFYRFPWSGPLMLVGFFVGLLAGAIWFTFLFNSTGGSVLLVALWHMTWNVVNVASMGWSEHVLAAMSIQVIILAVVVLWIGGAARLSTSEKMEVAAGVDT